MNFYTLEKLITQYLIKYGKGDDKKEIINMHQLNTDNSGDLMCAPYLYFDKLNLNSSNVDILGYLSKKDVSKSFSWVKKIKNKNIILGGGGLLDRKTFHNSINLLSQLQKQGNKIILWGVGHNNANLKPSKKYFNQINQFKLVGVRDYNIKNTHWIPCVSCMHTIFDKSYEPIREYGIIEHKNISIASNLNLPRIKNNLSFEEIVNFIGQTEKIITNSYHVMYWSILLKKKVIVIPNSSKMFSFKYSPIFCDNNEIQNFNNLFKKYKIPDGVLEECRNTNIIFSKKVFNYLNI